MMMIIPSRNIEENSENVLRTSRKDFKKRTRRRRKGQVNCNNYNSFCVFWPEMKKKKKN
jgi:hypothetical protein